MGKPLLAAALPKRNFGRNFRDPSAGKDNSRSPSAVIEFGMHVEYHKWFSPSLGRDMELKIFGHGGARCIVYPTSRGSFHEWEDRGMIQALGHHLGMGWLQIYCVSCVDHESWYDRRKHPRHRAVRQHQYDLYVKNEVLPLSQQKNDNPFVILTGASFGAYHAINFGLKFPECTGRIISMSGMCDIEKFCDGYGADEVFFNNPMAYIAHEHDPWRIRQLQQLDIILVVGRDDPLIDQNRRFSGLLWSKGIGNALREWDGWAHDWPWWRKMILHYIGGHD